MTTPATEVVDPVCGMTITPEDSVGSVKYAGQTYYFCNQSCLERFRETPEAFLDGAAKPPTGRGGGDVIRMSDGPGRAAV